MIICLCLHFAGRASAQWVVSDPGNLAQGIIKASKTIIHTSKTANPIRHLLTCSIFTFGKFIRVFLFWLIHSVF